MDRDNASIWNFDEARMKDLHFNMQGFEYAFEEWDLELLYKKIQVIGLIVSGADFSETEWGKVEEDFEKIESLKREVEMQGNEYKKQIEFFNKCKEVYKFLNRKMQDKGFFFRVREDEGL